jgi:TetR/AcrR family transcriptional regulator, regulator of cefoperazone and chloramphenicol sensitivity
LKWEFAAMTTRDRVLQAAVLEFAAKGYHTTTVADICRRAEANIAAVNYHFGSKEELYQEAWRRAHEASLAACPADGGVPAAAPAEERLRGRLRALLQRALREDDPELRIMERELLNPTGLLDQVIHRTIEPLREAMGHLLRELLGERADEGTVHLCALSVIGPCMHVLHRPRRRPGAGRPPWLRPEMLEPLTEHCTAFALAGIRDVRQRLESKASAETRKAAESTDTARL